MASVIKRYPLVSSAMLELASDLERLSYGLGTVTSEVVDTAVQHADKYFNGHLFAGTTAGRQAVIQTSTSVDKAEKNATGWLTATGMTTETGFNILYAVEFGAGIAYNWSGWNPSVPELGMGVGTWEPNKGHAFDFDGWVYFKGGEFHHTYGTPAAMPMHYTILDIKAEMPRLVKEAIRKWLT